MGTSTKLWVTGAILIVLGIIGWLFFSTLEENGRLQQSNAQLVQENKSLAEDREKWKNVADLNARVVAKSEQEKTKLAVESARLEKELEVLKHENAEVKKWAAGLVPLPVSLRLLYPSRYGSKNGNSHVPETVSGSHPGTNIEVQNENIYQYANELRAALLSCNADKAGIREYESGINDIF